MRRIFVVVGLFAVIALLALGTRTPSRAGVPYDRMVSTDGLGCGPGATTQYNNSITNAVNEADPDDTIFVCAGTYTEPQLGITKTGVSLLGPGSTPANDGVATIKLQTNASTNLFVNASGGTVSGLTFDATPNGSANTTGISTQNIQTITITHNIITGATSNGIYISQPSGTGPYTISENTIDSTFKGMYCTCPNAMITNNHTTSPGGFNNAINASGDGITISGNTVMHGSISLFGNNGEVSGNTVDGTGEDSNLIEVIGGNPVAVTGNNLSNITQTAIVLAENSLPINATITKNTLTHVRYGIQIVDFADKPAPVTALIGGSPANANVFINSGSASGESGRLLTLTIGTQNYNAEFNNWGLCTLAEIADQVYDHADIPSLGTIDYDPFIKPGGCPSVTASPTPSPSPTPTASPSPTPTGEPTPSPSPSPTASPLGQKKWGDIDCSGIMEVLDALKLMLGFLTLPYEKGPSCPDVGQGVVIAAAQTWGDIDCSEHVDEMDALYLLASLADTPRDPVNGCPAVGDPITLAVG